MKRHEGDLEIDGTCLNAMSGGCGGAVLAAKAADEKAGEAGEKTGAAHNDYELVVIGGGPGGYVAAIKAAQCGLKTALVEKERLGGACLNVGCIPTKTLLRSVECLREVKRAGDLGVGGFDAAKASLDMEKVQQRKEKLVSQLAAGVKGLLTANGVTVIHGQARLENKNRLAVGDQKITAANVIIATGSTARQLPVPVSPKMAVLTSTEMLDIREIPASVAIIGGGVIGIEFAYFLAHAGAKVTVIESLERILASVDEEITKQVAKRLINLGVTIYTEAKVAEITDFGVKFVKDGLEYTVLMDKVLMAVGRNPDISGIDCEALGISREGGAIMTDDTLRTSVANIFAIGDVNGKAMLAHAASAEGLVAVSNIRGHKAVIDYDRIPSVIYIQPEVACVGLTEAQAREQYGEVKVGKFPLRANGKAMVAGETDGLVKVIAESPSGRILGVHIYAAHASDMIGEAVVAMKLAGTVEEVALAVHPHPTVSEAVHEAMHAAGGRAIHCL